MPREFIPIQKEQFNWALNFKWMVLILKFVFWFLCIPLAMWSFQNLSVCRSCLSCSRGHDEIESGSTDRGPTRQATIRSRLRRKLQTDADAEDDDEKRTLRAEVLPQDGRISDLATKRLSLNIKKLYDLESLHRRELWFWKTSLEFKLKADEWRRTSCPRNSCVMFEATAPCTTPLPYLLQSSPGLAKSSMTRKNFNGKKPNW